MKNKKKQSSIVTITAFLILIAGLVVMGVSHYSLLKERDGLVAERAALEGKAEMLKKSYTQQRALAENSLRSRQAAEAKAARANQLVTEQESLVNKLQTELEGLEGELAKRRDAEQEQNKEVSEAIAQWKAKVEELQKAKAAGEAKIKEQDARIAALDGLAASTKASLDNETLQHRSCREKNITLSSIAQDLARSYRKKGVVDVLASAEPLTQLKKVELEKLVQEYLDRIDTETLPKTGAIPQ